MSFLVVVRPLTQGDTPEPVWGPGGTQTIVLWPWHALACPGRPPGTAESTCYSYPGTHLNACGPLPLDETDECTLFPSLVAGRIVFSATRDVWRGEAGREGSSHAGHCGKFLRKIRVLCPSGTPLAQQAGQAWGLWRTFVCVWVAYIVGRVCLCDMQWH